jgi:hypothetical protein
MVRMTKEMRMKNMVLDAIVEMYAEGNVVVDVRKVAEKFERIAKDEYSMKRSSAESFYDPDLLDLKEIMEETEKNLLYVTKVASVMKTYGFLVKRDAKIDGVWTYNISTPGLATYMKRLGRDLRKEVADVRSSQKAAG